jgi:hypothetical protein
MAILWSAPNNFLLRSLVERVPIGPGELSLPLITTQDVTVKLISGKIPEGLRVEGTGIVGTPVEVIQEAEYTFVLRANSPAGLQDITLRLTVVGADEPRWLTKSGRIPVGPAGALFILDNEIIDFSLVVVDPDLPAGDSLHYYIADGDGVLPPGIQLTTDGRLFGVVEPLLALDKLADNGGYDTTPYDVYPMDYAILSDNGFDSFFYDTVPYDFNYPTRSPRKLNRYYEFAVQVADKSSDPVRRTFQIYVVSDDYVKADNTIIKVSNGVFTADVTDSRTPRWITPPDLGFVRADNNVTLYLDTLETGTLEGVVIYNKEDLNPDGSVSTLPPGTKLDLQVGEITGAIPRQASALEEYTFTINATRYTFDIDIAVVTLQVYEDTFAGKQSFKIYKLPVGELDGIDDVLELTDESVVIRGRQYTIKNINSSNNDYEIVTLDRVLSSELAFTLAQQVNTQVDSFFVNRVDYTTSQRWTSKKLVYNEIESYTVEQVYPYVEWEISSLSGSISIDYAAAGIAPLSGGSETLASAINRIFGTTDLPVTIVTASNNTVRFIAADNSNTKKARLQAIFISDSLIKDLTFTLVDDTVSFVQLDKPLLQGRRFEQGQTIAIGVFEDDVIGKDLISSANQDITNPNKSRTFTIRVLGDVESNITWVTPSDLGSINANFTSTFSVVAETSAPDSRLLYTLVDGRLPYGLRLSYRGEIIGVPRQFAVGEDLGLTRIDGNTTMFDSGDTTFDRVYDFTVRAADRFQYNAKTKTFRIEVLDPDDTLYSNLYLQPFMKPELRTSYTQFVSDTDVFPPEDIYRPNDPAFGIRTKVRMLAFAGIENKTRDENNNPISPLAYIVAAAAKNHKRRRYNLGSVKRAVAKVPGTSDIVYEVIYVEVIDPADSKQGNTNSKFGINTTQSITADSSAYDRQDVEYNADFANSEPKRQRNHPYQNTITADSDGVVLNRGGDNLRHLSNTSNMRDRVREIGKTQREYLPLWMRTPQNNSVQELGYVTAIPLAYCKPGRSADVLLNVQNALSKNEFDFKQLDLDVDRYIVDRVLGVDEEKYIIFANYRFNE